MQVVDPIISFFLYLFLISILTDDRIVEHRKSHTDLQ